VERFFIGLKGRPVVQGGDERRGLGGVRKGQRGRRSSEWQGNEGMCCENLLQKDELGKKREKKWSDEERPVSRGRKCGVH